jgi:hypothetical protein
MELDWCSDENLTCSEKFNENSIINKDNKKNNNDSNIENNFSNDLNLSECFLLNLDNLNNKSILKIINYLSFISNYLRTNMRNKSTRYNEIKEIDMEEYNLIIKYFDWLILASNSIKKFFAVPIRRDNSYDPSNIKLFKTSSYKFCTFKESCTIHKNKQSKCEKNHFVFDMIINDIVKLKESIKIIGNDNINWVLNNNLILITYNHDTNEYSIEKITIYNNQELNENQFIIDKNLIFKSFDVVSYVLNKMYEESLYFLNNNVKTLLIDLK